jgi:HPt (histidine-containing phosphotransfer) domain-containing protein
VVVKYLTPGTTAGSHADDISFSKQFNRSYLQEIYGDDTEYALDMFSTFLEIIDGEFDKLHAAIRTSDKLEVKRMVHKIKPTFSMVGLTELTELFSDLEPRVKEQSIASSREEVNVVQERVNAVKPLLSAEKAKLYLQLNPE